DNSLAAIEQQYAGRPFLLVLWSRDCPICREELPLLGRLKKEHPDAPLVFVATDPPGPEADTPALLASSGLAGADARASAAPHLPGPRRHPPRAPGTAAPPRGGRGPPPPPPSPPPPPPAPKGAPRPNSPPSTPGGIKNPSAPPPGGGEGPGVGVELGKSLAVL